MYRMPSPQMDFEEFILPFPGKLRGDNRWIRLAQIIPWPELEKKYSRYFAAVGNPAKPLRMALGALIIKEKCGFSDEETVEQITENPYLQYFIGLKEFQQEPPFTPSLMVFFRKRLTPEMLGEINELICRAKKLKRQPDSRSLCGGAGGSPESPPKTPNRGKLLLDATCAPADIRYPTDLSLLNESREKLEDCIDILYRPLAGRLPRPRTHRRKARAAYLAVAKQKRPRAKMVRKAVGKQLRFIARNLRIVEGLRRCPEAGRLTPLQQRNLSIIQTLYEQQKTMYEGKSHSIPDRIVSIHQPHVRPMVRGKARNFVEFGAKVAVSLTDGLAFLEELSWDAFNESGGLIQAAQSYRRRFGFYPKAILADRIYRNRENSRFCQENGIRLSGARLGRPISGQREQDRRLARQDNRGRNAIEGKFGEGKRRYGLGRVMARLKDTAGSVIALKFLVMNLENRLRFLFARLWGSLISGLFCPKPAFSQG